MATPNRPVHRYDSPRSAPKSRALTQNSGADRGTEGCPATKTSEVASSAIPSARSRGQIRMRGP